ncbi:MAG: Sugar lactone lactonase YvrE [Hydrocarboniphaga sp.]|uniref:SMP-30/gluconolactonase/LRE family protein n=1 Tax=Hydrocarboniphaga sp. TaxID=2033016 RepID=UPI002627DFBF|nr:SMP-30/gluconolactonase/LRE family protein [Hydrocarboniphaga sp.]MDB5970942.1 Sugar lactone lactonase YvrE [Hydrocarboniphaga sp.]
MKIVYGALWVLATLAAYLLLWPVAIEPLAWQPSPLAASTPNDKLRGIQRIEPSLTGFAGPEGIALDAQGRVYAGLSDGQLLRFTADFSGCTLLDNTGGRPLGLAVAADGSLLIADARKGLMGLSANGELRALSDAADGSRFGFTDDVDVTHDGRRVYFTDASSRFGYGHHMDDLLEHGRSGRLLRYDFETAATQTLLQNRPFANGIALGPDEAYLLFAETWEYRVTRYWLSGDKAGQTDTFTDNLPGFPDNLSFNGRDRFWVALYSPRDAMLDQFLPTPWLRKIVARLPEALRPKPAKVAHVVGLDLDGHIVADLQYAGADAYGFITSVEERDGWLIFGSLSNTALGRIRLEDALATGPGKAPQAPLHPGCDAG